MFCFFSCQIEFHPLNEHFFWRISVKNFSHKSNTNFFFTCLHENKISSEIGGIFNGYIYLYIEIQLKNIQQYCYYKAQMSTSGLYNRFEK